MSNGDGLPKGWARANLREVAVPGGTRNPQREGVGNFHYVDIDALDNTQQIITNPKLFLKSEAPSRARMSIRSGDIVFSLVRPYLKNIAIVPPELDDQIASTAYCVLRPSNSLNSRFLFHQLLQDSFIHSIPTYGSSPPSARDDEFLDMKVRVAPTNEQRRIVAKIEELFSDLDAGVAALERAKAKLKRYRAAVLKAAVEGKLTEEWRMQNRRRTDIPVRHVLTDTNVCQALTLTDCQALTLTDKNVCPPGRSGRQECLPSSCAESVGTVETASQLLERILKERRRKWEQGQLAAYTKAGKKPPVNWKEKYKEPAAPDEANLPALPEGWCWATVDFLTVSGPRNGLYLPQSAYGTGVPILRIDDFQNTGSRPSGELRRVDAAPEDVEQYSLREKDLVVNRVNSMTHLGKCLAIEDRNLPALFESNMMRLSVSTYMSIRLVQTYLQSSPGRLRLTENAKWAVNQASINQQDVLATPVPIPPIDEQQQIVTEVERRLSIAQESETQIEANLKRSSRLRQSILKRAFEGKLVPQDPKDEPASVLLERVKANGSGDTPRKGIAKKKAARR